MHLCLLDQLFHQPVQVVYFRLELTYLAFPDKLLICKCLELVELVIDRRDVIGEHLDVCVELIALIANKLFTERNELLLSIQQIVIKCLLQCQLQFLFCLTNLA